MQYSMRKWMSPTGRHFLKDDGDTVPQSIQGTLKTCSYLFKNISHCMHKAYEGTKFVGLTTYSSYYR